MTIFPDGLGVSPGVAAGVCSGGVVAPSVGGGVGAPALEQAPATSSAATPTAAHVLTPRARVPRSSVSAITTDPPPLAADPAPVPAPFTDGPSQARRRRAPRA